MTLESEHNLASDSLGFPRWTFSSNTRQGEAMLESSAYITSFDKYDTCQKLDISQYKLLWSSFMFQIQYGMQRACDHPTTSPSPRGSVKNMWGRNKAPSHNGIKSTALPLIPSSSLCVLPSVQANVLGDSLHSVSRGWGKPPHFNLEGGHWKSSLQLQYCDPTVIITDEIMGEQMPCKP